MASFSVSEIKEKINRFEKKKLIHLPTPMKKLENLSQALGGPDIYMKRDDLTGLAFGGNKSRKLEFIIQDALRKKADVIITWASVQSNWCLQTVAAARKFGIEPILLLYKTYDLPEEYDGNYLLNYILDADIKIRESEKGKVLKMEDVQDDIDEVVNEVKERGHTPYIAPIGGSMVGGSMQIPLGAISYLNAYAEVLEQAEKENFAFNTIVLPTGSGGTQAGLVVGAKALGENVKILGMSVSDEKESFGKEVLTIAQDTVKALGLDLGIIREDIDIFDEYTKEGYGVVTKEISQAIRYMAVEEGIFLDPVYTGKAMVGLMDLVNKGFFEKKDKIIFFHTGGTPAIFPNKDYLVNFLKS